MDRLNGIDFKKGCYVGQEVVRGFSTEAGAQANYARDIAGKRPRQAQRSPLARSRSARWIVIRQAGLALIRLDKAEEARASARDHGGDRVLLRGFTTGNLALRPVSNLLNHCGA